VAVAAAVSKFYKPEGSGIMDSPKTAARRRPKFGPKGGEATGCPIVKDCGKEPQGGSLQTTPTQTDTR
jgi:hypothetical protein